MEDFRYDSYCGLYCGACEIIKAYQKELATGVKAGWEDLPEQFRKYIKEAEVVCHGCKSDTVFAGCQGCAVRACARGKNAGSCIQCNEYPCPHTKRLADLVQKVKEFLPHCKVMLRNLEFLKDHSEEEWLKPQEQRWKCPECGAGFSWYQEKCEGCGRELVSLKEHNKF